MRGVFLDIATYKPDDRHPALLHSVLEHWDFHEYTPPEKITARLEGADVLVTNKAKITADIIQQAKDLKLIVAGATGTDNIDAKAAAAHNITVCNVPDYCTQAVAQHVFALILSLSSNIIPYHNLVQSGAWEAATGFNLLEYPIYELSGKTLGVIGYGHIGKAVERIATAFGMNVLIAERPNADTNRAGRTAFTQMLQQSDIITIHCPLNDDTRGLIDADELAQMKDSAILINASRGGIIEETALAEALRGGIIAGAGLDVLSKEPPNDGNILLQLDMPNLIITPHCAWASEEARLRMFEIIAANITAFQNGAPINVVSA